MSNINLASVSGFLIEYGLLGLLWTMPPAMFLALGLKKKNRWVLFFGGGLFFFLGCVIFGITLEGLTTGEVFSLSRSTLMVASSDKPVFFWVSAAAFLGGSFFIAGFGVLLLVRACFPLNTK